MADTLTNQQRVQALLEFEDWRQDNAPTSLPNVAVESYLATIDAAELLDVATRAAEKVHKIDPALAERLRAIAANAA